jgi:hypothetical protein
VRKGLLTPRTLHTHLVGRSGSLIGAVRSQATGKGFISIGAAGSTGGQSGRDLFSASIALNASLWPLVNSRRPPASLQAARFANRVKDSTDKSPSEPCFSFGGPDVFTQPSIEPLDVLSRQFIPGRFKPILREVDQPTEGVSPLRELAQLILEVVDRRHGCQHRAVAGNGSIVRHRHRGTGLWARAPWATGGGERVSELSQDPRQQNALYGLPTRSGGCPLGRRLLQRRWIGNSPSGSLMGNDAVAFYFRHAALSIPDAIAIATMSEG